MSEERLSMSEILYGPRLKLVPGIEPVTGYALIDKIADRVWRATSPGGEKVAIKFIARTDPMGQGELNSFPFIHSVEHVNLLKVFSATEVKDRVVVIMELADEDLSSVCQRYTDQGQPGIPREELLDYTKQVAHVLDYLNTRHHIDEAGTNFSIAHTDVRAGNILLKDGVVKLADFGITVKFGDEPGMHSGITSFASPPEINACQVYRSSDQHSLAALYYFLLTGECYTLAKNVALLRGNERAVVERALSAQPSDRWPSCAHFVQELLATG